MYNNLLNFLKNEDCLIEIEAAPARMQRFIAKYNARYGEHLTLSDTGVILLHEGVNKWGAEMRLYVRNCPPPDVKELGFSPNDDYQINYSYRLNDNEIINYLFDQGSRIGYNEV